MSLPTSFSTSNATTQSPNTQSNPQPQTLQPRNSRCYYCVRSLILILVLLFVMVILIKSIAWSILGPHRPIIRLSSLSISNITESTPNYDIELNIKNPNKKINMFIDNFNIKVLYERSRTPLSETHISPIYLGKMTQTNITAKLERGMGNSMLGKGISNRSEVWSKDQVNLNVVMEIRTEFRAWNWLTKRKLMRVCCRNLMVKLSSKGSWKHKVGGNCLVHSRE